MPWTEERIETLRKLWAQGLSGSRIAERLGPEFTPNSVIGKAHRLELPGRESPIRRVVKNPEAPKLEVENPKPRVDNPREASNDNNYGNTEKTRSARIFSTHYSEDETCVWPIGEPNSPKYRQCGKPRDGRHPYCPEHCGSAFQSNKKEVGKNKTAK